MKAQRENEELVKVTFRIPSQLTKILEDRAIAERRSNNNQLIVLLEQALLLKEEGK